MANTVGTMHMTSPRSLTVSRPLTSSGAMALANRPTTSDSCALLKPQIPPPKHVSLKARVRRLEENRDINHSDHKTQRDTVNATKTNYKAELAGLKQMVTLAFEQKERDHQQRRADEESYRLWHEDWKERQGMIHLSPASAEVSTEVLPGSDVTQCERLDAVFGTRGARWRLSERAPKTGPVSAITLRHQAEKRHRFLFGFDGSTPPAAISQPQSPAMSSLATPGRIVAVSVR